MLLDGLGMGWFTEHLAMLIFCAHLVALDAKAPGQDDFAINKGSTCSVQRSGQFWPIRPVGGSRVKELGGGEGILEARFSTSCDEHLD